MFVAPVFVTYYSKLLVRDNSELVLWSPSR